MLIGDEDHLRIENSTLHCDLCGARLALEKGRVSIVVLKIRIFCLGHIKAGNTCTARLRNDTTTAMEHG